MKVCWNWPVVSSIPRRLLVRSPAGCALGEPKACPDALGTTGTRSCFASWVGSYFRRAAAARAEGLSCAVACPIFLGDVLTCVVVLLCGDAESHVGAVELWHNDPRMAWPWPLSRSF